MAGQNTLRKKTRQPLRDRIAQMVVDVAETGKVDGHLAAKLLKESIKESKRRA